MVDQRASERRKREQISGEFNNIVMKFVLRICKFRMKRGIKNAKEDMRMRKRRVAIRKVFISGGGGLESREEKRRGKFP